MERENKPEELSYQAVK